MLCVGIPIYNANVSEINYIPGNIGKHMVIPKSRNYSCYDGNASNSHLNSIVLYNVNYKM